MINLHECILILECTSLHKNENYKNENDNNENKNENYKNENRKDQDVFVMALFVVVAVDLKIHSMSHIAHVWRYINL